jgi:hypothetical protein
VDDGVLTRSIAYVSRYYEEPGYLRIFRAGEDGAVVWAEDSWYDEASGRMMWTGNTCSLYGVGYRTPDGNTGNIPGPEKAQLIREDGNAVQYDYSAVMPGGGARQAFTEDLVDAPLSGLLLLAGGVWYDVNGLTLRQALEQGRIDDPSPVYQAVLEDGAKVSGAASEVIDRINRLYPLDDPPNALKLTRAYEAYNALNGEERSKIAGHPAILDMLAEIEKR